MQCCNRELMYRFVSNVKKKSKSTRGHNPLTNNDSNMEKSGEHLQVIIKKPAMFEKNRFNCVGGVSCKTFVHECMHRHTQTHAQTHTWMHTWRVFLYPLPFIPVDGG